MFNVTKIFRDVFYSGLMNLTIKNVSKDINCTGLVDFEVGKKQILNFNEHEEVILGCMSYILTYPLTCAVCKDYAMHSIHGDACICDFRYNVTAFPDVMNSSNSSYFLQVHHFLNINKTAVKKSNLSFSKCSDFLTYNYDIPPINSILKEHIDRLICSFDTAPLLPANDTMNVYYP